MKLDVTTLAFIQGVIFVLQVIAIFVQYIVNKTYNGIKWWLAGTMLMAVGVILMPLAVVKPLQDYARVANPLAVLGLIF
ncbi:MAG: sensor domain-containing diguanylate cyclase, partial [Clostridiales bacterium]|nr:sensor domain-containing diguanylate cyclase [Clostridiales bacterium]